MTGNMTETRPGIALFDLDDTLVHGDSLLAWVGVLRGKGFLLVGGVIALVMAVLRLGSQQVDWRGRAKENLLRMAVRGVSIERAAAAGTELAGKMRWKMDMIARLQWHQQQGHRVVIVTGAASVYLTGFLAQWGFDDLLATELQVKDGVLTGDIVGENNVRAAKAARLAQWMLENGPFGESWGYGNAPHDLPMLAMVTHATVI